MEQLARFDPPCGVAYHAFRAGDRALGHEGLDAGARQLRPRAAHEDAVEPFAGFGVGRGDGDGAAGRRMREIGCHERATHYAG